MPVTVPQVWEQKAVWSQQIAPNGVIDVTPAGVLVLDKSPDRADLWRMRMLNASDGETRWATKYFQSRTGKPVAGWVGSSAKGHACAVTRAATTRYIYCWDGDSPRSSVSASAATRFLPAKGSKAPPIVTLTNNGVMVAGSNKGRFIAYDPGSGGITTFAKGPVRGKRPGVPLLVHEDGWLVAYQGGGFGYATPTGGWESYRSNLTNPGIPVGADLGGERVVGVGKDVIVALWSAANGKGGILAVHKIRSGEVIAQQGATDPPAITKYAKTHAPVVASTDLATFGWGNKVFDTGRATRNSFSLPLKGGRVAAIDRGVIYTVGGPTMGKPPTVYDLGSHQPLTWPPYAMTPVGVSSVDQGVFLGPKNASWSTRNQVWSVARR